MLECVIMFESIILEAHLCIMEHRFVESMGLSPAASRPLVLEWIRKMEGRISMQKETCRRRHSSWGHGTLFKFDQTWDTLMRELRSLRQLPSNSTVLQTWQELIDAIVGTSKPPSASLLLETSPFTSLILLTSRLLPIFQDSEGAPTRVYKDAIDLVRTTLRRLQGGKPDRSFGRMELFPPGSPEFSPPYTRVYKPSDLTVKALSEQLDSVRMLELELVPSDVLHLLDSLPQSLPSLTSLVIRDRVRSLPSEPNFLTQTLPSILRKHQNIVSLQLGEGERIDKEVTDSLRKIVFQNRKRWKQNILTHDSLSSIIGIQLRAAVARAKNSDLRISQQGVVLTKNTEIFAIIFIPQPGKIIPVLSLRVYRGNVTIIARLKLPEKPESDTSATKTPADELTLKVKKSFSASSDSQSLLLDGFSELPRGCYELRIATTKKAKQHLFKELTFEFVPSSSSGQPVGSGAAPSEAEAPQIQPLEAGDGVEVGQGSAAEERQGQDPSNVESESGSRSRPRRQSGDRRRRSSSSDSDDSSSSDLGSSDAGE
ncbi:hypothetical protein PM082_011581 [Marasmius tenuissimus]|nr:hypothetical protein PM082_011581 [Marasmius tenuissimus]